TRHARSAAHAAGAAAAEPATATTHPPAADPADAAHATDAAHAADTARLLRRETAGRPDAARGAAEPPARADAPGPAPTPPPPPARADEPDTGRRRAGRPGTDAAASAARAAAEEFVQDRGEIGGLRVLDVVHECLPPRSLLGRDVEQPEPALHLVEHG